MSNVRKGTNKLGVRSGRSGINEDTQFYWGGSCATEKKRDTEGGKSAEEEEQ